MPRMPSTGCIWRHVVLSTHGSWLPGDPRGWRSRYHKRHSSGDYQTPPPDGEHRGLHELAQSQCDSVVMMSQAMRETVGILFLQSLQKAQVRVLALAVAGCHLHTLVELPTDPQQARRIIGRCKEQVTRKLQRPDGGKFWASGGKFQPIRDEKHHRATYDYILRHRDEGAWVWTYRDGL